MRKINEKIKDSISNLNSVSNVLINFLKSKKNKKSTEIDSSLFDNQDNPRKTLNAYFYYGDGNCLSLSISLKREPNDIEKKIILNQLQIIKEVILLREQIHFDMLTKAGNIKKLKEDLNFEIARSKREGTKFCLLFLDIDHFKNINDTLGHEIGNIALKKFSGFIEKNTRFTDRVYRYGGDEFVLLLVDTDKEHSKFVVEKLTNRLSEKAFSIKKHRIKLKFSYGISEFPLDADDADSLLHLADKELLMKKKGRTYGSQTR